MGSAFHCMSESPDFDETPISAVSMHAVRSEGRKPWRRRRRMIASREFGALYGPSGEVSGKWQEERN